jgi:hypothetical protein
MTWQPIPAGSASPLEPPASAVTSSRRAGGQVVQPWASRQRSSDSTVNAAVHMVNTTAVTTTRTGLRVHAELDASQYTTGSAVSDTQMAALAITPRLARRLELHPAS